MVPVSESKREVNRDVRSPHVVRCSCPRGRGPGRVQWEGHFARTLAHPEPRVGGGDPKRVHGGHDEGNANVCFWVGAGEGLGTLGGIWNRGDETVAHVLRWCGGVGSMQYVYVMFEMDGRSAAYGRFSAPFPFAAAVCKWCAGSMFTGAVFELQLFHAVVVLIKLYTPGVRWLLVFLRAGILVILSDLLG